MRLDVLKEIKTMRGDVTMLNKSEILKQYSLGKEDGRATSSRSSSLEFYPNTKNGDRGCCLCSYRGQSTWWHLATIVLGATASI